MKLIHSIDISQNHFLTIYNFFVDEWPGPYCQKTMLLIEEKEVPINIELVPMRSYGVSSEMDS